MGILILFFIVALIAFLLVDHISPKPGNLHESDKSNYVPVQYREMSYHDIFTLSGKLMRSFQEGISKIEQDSSLTTAQKEEQLKQFRAKFASQYHAKIAKYPGDLLNFSDYCLTCQIKDKATVTNVEAFNGNQPICRVSIDIDTYCGYLHFDTKDLSAKKLNKNDVIEIRGNVLVYNKVSTVLRDIKFKKI